MHRSLIIGFVTSIIAISLAGCGVSPTTLGISQQQWNTYSPQQQQEFVANYKRINSSKEDDTTDDEGLLQVTISDGTIMMSPFTTRYPYAPARFEVEAGSCEHTKIYSANSKKSVVLISCFKNNVFVLDPSRYELNKKDGTARFHYLPLWKQGFTYHKISSSGYVKLQNVTVRIKKVEPEIDVDE